jgi:hypothetical protein
MQGTTAGRRPHCVDRVAPHVPHSTLRTQTALFSTPPQGRAQLAAPAPLLPYTLFPPWARCLAFWHVPSHKSPTAAPRGRNTTPRTKLQQSARLAATHASSGYAHHAHHPHSGQMQGRPPACHRPSLTPRPRPSAGSPQVRPAGGRSAMQAGSEGEVGAQPLQEDVEGEEGDQRHPGGPGLGAGPVLRVVLCVTPGTAGR